MCTRRRSLPRAPLAAHPGYIIPADHKWVTRTAVAEILTATIRDLDPSYPQLSGEQEALLGGRTRQSAHGGVGPSSCPQVETKRSSNNMGEGPAGRVRNAYPRADGMSCEGGVPLPDRCGSFPRERGVGTPAGCGTMGPNLDHMAVALLGAALRAFERRIRPPRVWCSTPAVRRTSSRPRVLRQETGRARRRAPLLPRRRRPRRALPRARPRYLPPKDGPVRRTQAELRARCPRRSSPRPPCRLSRRPRRRDSRSRCGRPLYGAITSNPDLDLAPSGE